MLAQGSKITLFSHHDTYYKYQQIEQIKHIFIICNLNFIKNIILYDKIKK